MELCIPGYEKLNIENLVLDYNGTIAFNGKIIDGVNEKVIEIAKKGISVYIITADTHNTVYKQCEGLPVEILKLKEKDEVTEKFHLVEKLGLSKTACIGNGRNDEKMLRESALSIGIIGGEGAFTRTIYQSTIVCTNILDALNLFLNEKALIADLRG